MILANLPNLLSATRIVLLLPLIALLLTNLYHIALVVFIVASVMDWLDGFLARKLDKQSEVGAVLDHIADKLLICVTLITLLFVQESLWSWLATIVVVSRDIVLGGMRELWLQTKQSNKAKVSFFGKWKTALQMLSICAILLLSGLQLSYVNWYIAFAYTAIIVITLLSLAHYLKKSD